MNRKVKSTHPPLCPCKAFVTDGLLIRWNGDRNGNGIRMGILVE